MHALLLHHCILRRRAYDTVSPLSRCSSNSQTWLRRQLLIEQLLLLTLWEASRLPRSSLSQVHWMLHKLLLRRKVHLSSQGGAIDGCVGGMQLR